MDYQYQKSKWPFHRCQSCGKRIKRSDNSMTKYIPGIGGEVWFCSKECARDDYLWFLNLAKREEELYDYFTKGKH